MGICVICGQNSSESIGLATGFIGSVGIASLTRLLLSKPVNSWRLACFPIK